MIRTDCDTERLAGRQRVKKWSPELSKAALRKLRMLDAAEELTDLRVPPVGEAQVARLRSRCLVGGAVPTRACRLGR